MKMSSGEISRLTSEGKLAKKLKEKQQNQYEREEDNEFLDSIDAPPSIINKIKKFRG
jgi:hypothetical protein